MSEKNRKIVKLLVILAVYALLFGFCIDIHSAEILIFISTAILIALQIFNTDH